MIAGSLCICTTLYRSVSSSGDQDVVITTLHAVRHIVPSADNIRIVHDSSTDKF